MKVQLLRRKGIFSSSFAVTSSSQRRRAQRIRAQNRLKDSACKAQLELDEEQERHKCELSLKRNKTLKLLIDARLIEHRCRRNQTTRRESALI